MFEMQPREIVDDQLTCSNIPELLSFHQSAVTEAQ